MTTEHEDRDICHALTINGNIGQQAPELGEKSGMNILCGFQNDPNILTLQLRTSTSRTVNLYYSSHLIYGALLHQP